MLNFFILFLGIISIQKYLQTKTQMLVLNGQLVLLRNIALVLFVVDMSVSENHNHSIKMFWSVGFIYLLYLLYQNRQKNGIAKVLLKAAVPFVAVSIIDDLFVFWTPKFHGENDNFFTLLNIGAITWLIAFGFGAVNQFKALKVEQEKLAVEKAKKETLENIVAERTAELVQQKEVLEKALAELKAAQNQLVQSEKLASLGELTAGIAHEIQNPLNFVNNFSELSVDLVNEINEEMKNEVADKSYISELMADLAQNQEKINHHGKRASSIVKNMLEHSRASKGERALADINTLCDEYLRLSYQGMRVKNKDFNSDFKVYFDENLPKISVIPQDLGRVLLNLMNNAFYAVHQRNTELPHNPTVVVSTMKTKNNIEIKIKDNGNGIPKENLEKIFQPFFTTKPTGEGTGLGLSLSYDIITKGHGGTLDVESVEGEGTTFIVKLPFETK